MISLYLMPDLGYFVDIDFVVDYYLLHRHSDLHHSPVHAFVVELVVRAKSSLISIIGTRQLPFVDVL